MKETIISRAELFELLEYSCSLPTGTTIGKRWRCDVHSYRNAGLRAVPAEQHEWRIGEYVEHPDPERVGIEWTWAVDSNGNPHRGTKEKQ